MAYAQWNICDDLISLVNKCKEMVCLKFGVTEISLKFYTKFNLYFIDGQENLKIVC